MLWNIFFMTGITATLISKAKIKKIKEKYEKKITEIKKEIKEEIKKFKK